VNDSSDQLDISSANDDYLFLRRLWTA